MQETAQSTAKN